MLILPHHGSLTPNLGDFIEAVQPDILLQSSASRYEPKELLEALGRRRRYDTFRHGWIAVDLADRPLQARTMRED